jgi:Transposase DDE domain group 1
VRGRGRWCGPNTPRSRGCRCPRCGSPAGNCACWSSTWTPRSSSAIATSRPRRRGSKGTFGFHPLAAFCDNTREFLAGRLRPGNAGANTAADHIEVLDQALAQVPDQYRHGTPILIRTDAAGCTRAFLAHIRVQHEHDVACEFSVGWAITDRERQAIALIAESVWADAVDTDASYRDGAGLAEITGLLPAKALAGYPDGTRVIVRRERPHPGAQLDLIEERDGWRYTALATDTHAGQLTLLDARHRAHARVEDRIRIAKDTGLDPFPSRAFAINQAWLALVMLATDLTAWTQHLLLDGELAKAEPKHCATGCCTSPPASPEDNAGSGSASSSPGPGPATSPPRSTASPRCPSPPADRPPTPQPDRGGPGRTAGRTPRLPTSRNEHGFHPPTRPEDQLVCMNDQG